MQHIELLVTVLEYIEIHLRDDIKTDDIASACFCSKSALEKLFRSVYHISVHGYIVRRRMMLAAKQLSMQPQRSILDIAIEYGYSTHESFARAFEQIWNCKPSAFRSAKYTELFPRFIVPPTKGDDDIMQNDILIFGDNYIDYFRKEQTAFLSSVTSSI